MTDEMPKEEALAQAIDVELSLRRMHDIKQTQAELEDEYVELREAITPIVDEPTYFVDQRGEKRYGYRVEPEKVIVDIDLLEQEVDEQIFDKVTKRLVDTDAFKAAVAAGHITSAQVLKVARIEKGTPHIRFGDPDKPRRA